MNQRSSRRGGAEAPRDHYPAPYAIIDLWARYGAHGAAAFEAEARSIAELFTTETARNLIRVFMLQDRLKALGGKPAAPVKHVHVVGAGVMGGDIAAWSRCAALASRCRIASSNSSSRRSIARTSFSRSGCAIRRRSRPPLRASRADVTETAPLEADVVIEAIFENLDAKRAALRARSSRA